MVNYYIFENIINLKKARNYLTSWHIETLKKAISRNPGSKHNEAREMHIRDLEAKLEVVEEE